MEMAYLHFIPARRVQMSLQLHARAFSGSLTSVSSALNWQIWTALKCCFVVWCSHLLPMGILNTRWREMRSKGEKLQDGWQRRIRDAVRRGTELRRGVNEADRCKEPVQKAGHTEERLSEQWWKGYHAGRCSARRAVVRKCKSCPFTFVSWHL